MKRLYEWITKANQVLLFLVLLGAAAYVAGFFYDLKKRRWEPPSVAVAQTAEEAKSSVVLEVRFLGQVSGIYVFGLMKRVVVDEQAWLRASASLGSEDSRYPGYMVNVVFSKGDQPLRKLLPKDGLVLSDYLLNEQDPYKFSASRFTCVTEDTDGNHQLDEKDRNDLYIISANLDRPDMVFNGVLGDRVISPTHIMVKTGTAKDPHFWDVDVETQAKKEIPWK
ncbi:MAG TPA: hypothetical protein VGW57_16740 [Chthoniobacterales bacterium]|nr:hypothetical protein [Chthoniobacterales bacterium]